MIRSASGGLLAFLPVLGLAACAAAGGGESVPRAAAPRPSPAGTGPGTSGGHGSGFTAHEEAAWRPADPDIAVGPGHLLTTANQEIAWWTRAGRLLERHSLLGSAGFWGAAGAGDFVFDPVVTWDPLGQRFLVAAAEYADDGEYLLLAASSSAFPQDPWILVRHRVSPGCRLPDYPNLGVNEEAVLISCDCLTTGGARLYAWDKAALYAGTPSPPMEIQLSSHWLAAANTTCADPGRDPVLLTSFSGSLEDLLLLAIRDPLGSPVVEETLVPVPAFDHPPDVDQAGTSVRVDVIDFRFKDAELRDDRLYAAHTIGADGLARVRWYALDLQGWPESGLQPVLEEAGEAELPAGVHGFYPDLAVDADGNLALAWSRSSAAEAIGAEGALRRAGDPPGSLRGPFSLGTSTGAWFGDRWGDYQTVAADPFAPGLFWTHLMLQDQDRWRSLVAPLRIDPEAPVLRGPEAVGASWQWTVEGASPGASILLAWSFEAGATPAACGAVLWLNAPRAGPPQAADLNGRAVFTAAPPPAAAGRRLLLQALDLDACRTTNRLAWILP